MHVNGFILLVFLLFNLVLENKPGCQSQIHRALALLSGVNQRWPHLQEGWVANSAADPSCRGGYSHLFWIRVSEKRWNATTFEVIKMQSHTQKSHLNMWPPLTSLDTQKQKGHSINQCLVCQHMCSSTHTKNNFDVPVLYRWMAATKTHPASTIPEDGLWLPTRWLINTVTSGVLAGDQSKRKNKKASKQQKTNKQTNSLFLQPFHKYTQYASQV